MHIKKSRKKMIKKITIKEKPLEKDRYDLVLRSIFSIGSSITISH